MIARRIVIAGSSLAFSLVVFLIQGFLALLGINRSVAVLGLDVVNAAFFVTYLLSVFMFIWGAVGPLPQ